MTATGELRRLLDERGVEWMPSVWSAKDETFYKVGDVGYLATELSNGKMKVCIEGYPTPEQAIAAALGDVPRLPYFWTHDGTLHIELPKLPESISVRLPDQRDREVGSARTWQYTRDTGTCHVECFDDGVDEGLDGEPIFTSPTWYLSCGHTTQDSERPNFCPVCGRVVDA